MAPADLPEVLSSAAMTSRPVYFICGSRSLDSNPWVRRSIELWLPRAGPALVVTGGAKGPDTVGLSVAGERGLETLVIFSDGFAMSSAWSSSRPWHWFYDLRFPDPPWSQIEGKKRPLARNAFMADLLGSMQNRAHRKVVALALPDSNSQTGGTRHMIRCLHGEGIVVEVIEEP